MHSSLTKRSSPHHGIDGTCRRSQAFLAPETNCRIAACNAQLGASMVEYALVLLFFGIILFGATSFFESSSEDFYESSTGGFLLPYPPNYIPEPAPTAATPQLQ